MIVLFLKIQCIYYIVLLIRQNIEGKTLHLKECDNG